MKLLALWLMACGPIYAPPPPPPQQPPQQPPVTEAPPAQDRAPAPDPTPTAPTPPPTPPPLVSGGKPPAKKTTQAELAAHLGHQAEQLYAKASYADASSKLREAVARVPEARYFYNLCASLFMEGKYSEALTACDAVDRQSPSAELRQRTDGLLARIRDEARNQHLDVR
jgi:hypothetical protein